MGKLILPFLMILSIIFLSVNKKPVQTTLTINDDISIPSFASGHKIDKAFESVGATRLVGYGKFFVKAEREYGINAIFMAAIALHESNLGTSRIAIEKNNLFGWGAYDESPFSSATTFPSIEVGIMYVTSRIKDFYYSNGYTTPEKVGMRYASDPDWAEKVVKWASRIKYEIEEGF